MRRQRAAAGHRPSCLGRILAFIVPLGIVIAGALFLFPSLRDRLDEWRDPDDPHVVEAGDEQADAVIGAAVDHPDIDSISCIETGFNGMTAVVDLTNRGNERTSYMIEVAFESPDGGRQLETSSAYITHLEPGQQVTDEAASYEGAPDGGWRCRVTEFVRTGD